VVLVEKVRGVHQGMNYLKMAVVGMQRILTMIPIARYVDIKKGYMFIAVGSTINTINDIKKGYMFIAVGTLYIQ
jgi:hypothetical protein